MPSLSCVFYITVALSFAIFSFSMFWLFKKQWQIPEQFKVVKADRSKYELLYQTGQANLLSFKETQWNITNYSVLAIASLLAVYYLCRDRHIFDGVIQYVIALLAIVVTEFGVHFITDLQLGIQTHRVSINKLKEVLFKSGMPGYTPMTVRQITKDQRFFRDFKVPLLFYLTIIVALAFAILLVFTPQLSPSLSR